MSLQVLYWLSVLIFCSTPVFASVHLQVFLQEDNERAAIATAATKNNFFIVIIKIKLIKMCLLYKSAAKVQHFFHIRKSVSIFLFMDGVELRDCWNAEEDDMLLFGESAR